MCGFCPRVRSYTSLQFDGPSNSELQLWNEAAAADSEFREETVLVLKPEEVTAAGMQLSWRIFKATELRDADRRAAALDQRPCGRAQRKLHDQVDVDIRQPQAVAEAAIDTGTDAEPAADIGRLPGDAGIDLLGIDRRAAAEAY